MLGRRLCSGKVDGISEVVWDGFLGAGDITLLDVILLRTCNRSSRAWRKDCH